MPLNSVSQRAKNNSPNREAYLLLWTLLERSGMSKAALLARLADHGHCINDDTFTNWGRPGRAFPRNWSLLRAMIRIVSDPSLEQPCTAHEALYFWSLTGLPFAELPALAELFSADAFEQALLPYLPGNLAERLARIERPAKSTLH